MSLLRLGGKPFATHERMLECSVTGNMDLAQSLMALDPTVLQARNSHGLSSLQIAIINHHYHFAEHLIKMGVNIHSKDNCGWTALHDAALFSCQELVNILVKYGCDVIRKTCSGELPIDVAADEIMESLLCEKMAEAGHTKLATGYWVKLGLGHLCSNEDSSSWLEGLNDTDCVDSGKESKRNVRSQENGIDLVQKEDGGQHNKSISGVDSSLLMNTSTSTSSQYEHQEACHAHHESGINKVSCDAESSNYSSSCAKKRSKTRYTPLSPLPECLKEDTEENAECDLYNVVNFQQARSPVPKRKSGLAVSSSSMSRGTSRSISRSQSHDTFNDTIPSSCSRLDSAEITRSSSDFTMYLTPEELAKLEQRSSPHRAMTDRAPIELLKMRPRKPSIVDKKRTRSKDFDDGSPVSNGSNRRSVSFQPEVLLQEVVTEGDTDLAKEIISSGNVDVNKMSPVGLTALHQCALDGNIELSRTLVSNGAYVNSIDADGWTPLHGAAATGHTEMVRFLLVAGSDPLLKNDDDEIAYDLAKRGSIRRMLFRAASGKTLDPSEDDVSDGEFSSGEEEEDYSHVEYESDEDDVCLSDSDPSLAASTWNCRMSFIQRASRTNQTVSPPPPRSESTDNVFAETSPTLSSMLLQDRDTADSTSSYGSMVDQDMADRHSYVDEDTETSTLCNEEPYLTDTDKETYYSEDQGISTMGDASSDSSHRKILCSDDEGTFRDVLDSDLDPDTPDYKFQEAVLNCDIENVTRLLKLKSEIDVNRVNKLSGISALHHSVLEENYALVQHLLCDFKCDVNLKDSDGWTPLHAASAVGNIQIAQFLLDNGAKASILNKNCEFPVDVAEDERMEELLKKAMLGPSIGKIFKGYFR